VRPTVIFLFLVQNRELLQIGLPHPRPLSPTLTPAPLPEGEGTYQELRSPINSEKGVLHYGQPASPQTSFSTSINARITGSPSRSRR
jgi:hypothetical protein